MAKHTYEDPVVLQGGRGQILTTNFILRHTNVTSGSFSALQLLPINCLSTILEWSSTVKDETAFGRAWGGSHDHFPKQFPTQGFDANLLMRGLHFLFNMILLNEDKEDYRCWILFSYVRGNSEWEL